MTFPAIDAQVYRGALVRMERGIYRSSLAPDKPEQAPMAAALRARPDARISGPFVLWLHGLGDISASAPWEVLTAVGRKVRGVDFLHRPNPSPGDGIVVFRGLPTVPVTTALVDSGRFIDVLGGRALRLAYDSSRWRKLTTPKMILERAQRLGPADPGAAVFLEWHERGELVPESDGERRLGRIVCRIAPPPQAQVRVRGFRVDWYWPLYRFGLEYQGVVDHRSAKDRQNDIGRSHALRRADIHILPVSDRDFRYPDALLGEVLRRLTERAHELGLPNPTLV